MTEQEVNKAALGALRYYYRLRIKKDSPVLTSDVRGAGGIIADGSYSFEKDDGERFLATIEATSLDKKDEVYYRIHRWLLLWDSFAVSSMLTALLFTISFIQGVVLVRDFGIWQTICVLIMAFLLLTLLYLIAFRKLLRRYRYIYAVEQFKNYHADEQWIAISEEVFPGNRDKRFLELRDQCIYNGFGLILVDNEKRANPIITPARRELFESRRQVVQFFTPNQINRILKRTSNITEWWKKWSKGLPIQFNLKDPRYFFRFRRPVYNQMIICGIAWVIIAAVFFREWQERPIRYISQQTYNQEAKARQKQGDPEPNRPIILAADSIFIRPFDNTVIPYLLLLQTQSANSATTSTASGGNEFLTGILNDVLVVYDCERLYNFNTPKLMLQEAVYPDFETASRRMSQLLAAGLQTNMLWLGCFAENDERYVVYFDLLMDKRDDAEKLYDTYDKTLKEKNLNATVSIKTLVPKR